MEPFLRQLLAQPRGLCSGSFRRKMVMCWLTPPGSAGNMRANFAEAYVVQVTGYSAVW